MQKPPRIAEISTKVVGGYFFMFTLYVCQMITCESIDVESSNLHIRYISTDYVSSSNMKVIESRSRSQEPKRSYSRNVSRDVCVQHGVFGYGGSNGVTAIFVT